jgi:class 3 adenylate cyclase
MSFKAKLMIALISLAVIPILIANLINYSYSSSALKDLVRSESRTIVHKLKYEMEVLHKNAVFNLAGISEMKVIQENLTPTPSNEQRIRVERLLESMLATSQIFDSYQLISLRGNQIYKVYRDKTTKKIYFPDMTDREYFQKSISTRKPFISDILISKATKRPIVIIGHPILDRHGKVMGVISAIVNYQAIISLITELRSTPGAHPFITSQSGLILAHVDKSLVAKKNFLQIVTMDAEGRDSFVSKNVGFLSYSRNNEKRFVYFSVNKTGKYKLCYSIPRAGFFKSIDRLMLIIFFVVGVVSVLSTILALVISKKVGEAMSVARIASQEVSQKNQELEGLATKLAKYLSPQLYESIFTGDKDVKLETYRKKLTVFFSDIKDFSDITDSMQSESLSAILNEYLNEMSKIAIKHGGTIDKFIGDAIMVFFGDPESKGEEEDALACVSMAIEMRDTMHALQELWVSMGISRPMKIRIGVNSGYCTIGNFGSNQRMDYTIVGGEVNLASRLESAAKVDSILISHETYGLIKDRIACTSMGDIKVKGIAHTVKTYEVQGFSDSAIQTKQISVKADGFALSIDLDRQTDKEEAIGKLKEVIRQIKES